MAKPGKRKLISRRFGLIMMGAYVPAFINIHFRYAKNNFKAWAALFVAPFLAVKLFLMRLFEMLPEDDRGVWHFDLLAIFVISICFYLAERFDNVRRFYVWGVPVAVFLGMIYWASGQGSNEIAGFAVKLLLIAYLTYRVGKFTIKEGYEQLNDGADADYHAGKDLYDAADYKAAIPLLENSAERGHFKSLYLLGDAYEYGHHYSRDPVKAATNYYRASQKGYGPATRRYEALIDSFSSEQKLEFESQSRLIILAP